MGQEQKPFEVMTGVVVLGQKHSFKVFADGKADLFAVSTAVKIIAKYAINANAEIRRLQGEVEELEETSKNKDEAIAGLNNQLADAPTWGDWVEREVVIDGKIYEVAFTDGSTRLMDNEELRDVLPQNQYNDNKVTQFRRLQYTPQPAREVEKKYRMSGRNYTLCEIADWEYCNNDTPDLARDLLAAQERIRELEGK